MADNTKIVSISENKLLYELSQLIEQSKHQVSIQANSAITILFWQVGNHINQDILENKRAEYAKKIVSTLSTQLSSSHFLAITPIKNTKVILFYTHHKKAQILHY